MIDLTIHEDKLKNTIELAKRRGVVIPTFRQMKDPIKYTPESMKERLRHTGLWDIDPANLFRITWKNEPQKSGGLFGAVNTLEFPQELTGVKARIIALTGKWFPTGAHKVGASFGCLAPRLITGQFDPTTQKAVWPSTGNFCRGGAYNAALLGCESIAILPKGMSRERFEWLETVAGEIIATPGEESNIKEIYDAVAHIRATRGDAVVFNQFDEMGNHLWHYTVTGSAMEEAVRAAMGPNDRFAGAVAMSGSAGTTACGDYLKEVFPHSKMAVGEALQSPSLFNNGLGEHRIEGVGDKHIPWVHNVRNTDMVIAVDDNICMAMIRLCNEPEGIAYLRSIGIAEDLIARLSLMGISGAANVAMAIKMAKYYELTENDIIVTVLTDSMELYGSRLEEMRAKMGPYTAARALADHERYVLGMGLDGLQELTYNERKRIHNLKYYTWVEQLGKSTAELNAQWYDHGYWAGVHRMADKIDELIDDFNSKTGLA